MPRIGDVYEKGDQVVIPWNTPTHSGEAILSLEMHRNLPGRIIDFLNKTKVRAA